MHPCCFAWIPRPLVASQSPHSAPLSTVARPTLPFERNPESCASFAALLCILCSPASLGVGLTPSCPAPAANCILSARFRGSSVSHVWASSLHATILQRHSLALTRTDPLTPLWIAHTATHTGAASMTPLIQPAPEICIHLRALVRRCSDMLFLEGWCLLCHLGGS